jgi:hypothetical protein
MNRQQTYSKLLPWMDIRVDVGERYFRRQTVVSNICGEYFIYLYFTCLYITRISSVYFNTTIKGTDNNFPYLKDEKLRTRWVWWHTLIIPTPPGAEIRRIMV